MQISLGSCRGVCRPKTERVALKQDCDQRGSLCDGDKLRFDFAYDKPLDATAIKATLKAAVTAMPALAGRLPATPCSRRMIVDETRQDGHAIVSRLVNLVLG